MNIHLQQSAYLPNDFVYNVFVNIRFLGECKEGMVVVSHKENAYDRSFRLPLTTLLTENTPNTDFRAKNKIRILYKAIAAPKKDDCLNFTTLKTIDGRESPSEAV